MWPVSYKILKELKNEKSQAREMKEFMLLIVAYYASNMLAVCIIYILFHQNKWRLSEKNQMVKQVHSIHQNMAPNQGKALETFSKWHWNEISLFLLLYSSFRNTSTLFSLSKMFFCTIAVFSWEGS